MVHLKERNQLYTYRRADLKEAMVSIQARLINQQVDVSQPIFNQMQEMNIIMYFLDNLLFTVIFFLCMLSFILIFSLIQSDADERQYEFAVLRTLGLKNKNLLLILAI